MLRITAATMDAFIAEADRAFESRVVGRLRDNFPHLRERSDDSLNHFVRQGRSRANGYGIRSPYAVSLYVGFMAELGADFDESGKYPWAEQVLRQQRTGNDKVGLICERLLIAPKAVR